MKTSSLARNMSLEQISQEAMEAANEGKWQLVNILYRYRARDNRWLDQVTPEIAKQLMLNDQRVIDRIRQVQAAILQNIEDIQDRKRKLTLVKEQWGNTMSVQGRYRTSV